MAGSYPDAPWRRMAWDEDGTIFWHATTLTPYFTGTVMPGFERTVVEKGYANNEETLANNGFSDIEGINNGGGGGSLNHAYYIIFPELRDVYGVAYWAIAGNSGSFMVPTDFEYSTNTTNGIDGDWVSIYPTYPIQSVVYALYSWDHWYRIGIVTDAPLPVSGVRGLRWIQLIPSGLIAQGYWNHIHIYGDKSTGATPDRLLFIDNDTGLEFTGPLDWGDVPRGTTLTHQIKVKNNSATLTANTIVLDFEALTGVSDTWHTMSDSGGAFGGTLNITSIAPTASYPAANTITIKLIVGDAENLGLQSCRLQASTTSWT